jgi:hypothetical protein
MSAVGPKRPIRHVRFMSAVRVRSRLDMLSRKFSGSDPKATSRFERAAMRISKWRPEGTSPGPTAAPLSAPYIVCAIIIGAGCEGPTRIGLSRVPTHG